MENISRHEILLKQLELCNNEIVSIETSFLNMQQLFFAALIAGAAIGLAGDDNKISPDPMIFFLMALIFCWFLYNIIKYTIKQLEIGGYRRYLEEQLNGELNEYILLWESEYGNSARDRFTGGTLQVLYILPIGVFLAYECIVNLAVFNMYGFALMCIVIALQAAGLIYLCIVMATAGSEAYKKAVTKGHAQFSINDKCNQL